MKNLKMTIAAIALASVSFGSFAAELVNAQPADLQKAGVVTVSGASDLSSFGKQTGGQSRRSRCQILPDHRNHRRQQIARYRDHLQLIATPAIAQKGGSGRLLFYLPANAPVGLRDPPQQSEPQIIQRHQQRKAERGQQQAQLQPFTRRHFAHPHRHHDRRSLIRQQRRGVTYHWVISTVSSGRPLPADNACASG